MTYHAVWMPRKPAWFRVLIFHWKLRRCLDHSAYDVVLGMTPFFPQTLFWLGDGLNAVWTRVAWPNPILRRLMCLKRAVMAVNLSLERKILSPATPRFIANSQLVRRQALAHYGVPEERVAVAYPGVDMTRFHPGVRRQWRAALRRQLGIGDEEVTFLFVSTIQTQGTRPDLRSSGARRSRRRYRWLVVGAVTCGAVSRLARRLASKERLFSPVSSIESKGITAPLTVFILTPLYDPFAVCLEAMACGCLSLPRHERARKLCRWLERLCHRRHRGQIGCEFGRYDGWRSTRMPAWGSAPTRSRNSFPPPAISNRWNR